MKIYMRVSLAIIGFILFVSLAYAKNLVKILLYNPSSQKLEFSEIHKP